MIEFGFHGSYEWLVFDEDVDLLEICPQIVVDRYIAITSSDSGIYELNRNEAAAGWSSRDKVAYSPRIRNIGELRRSPERYDEWYIFDGPVNLGMSHLGENIFEVPQEQGHLSIFVNYGFALHLPERAAGLSDLFWTQMNRIRPESYLADNDYLTFASANNRLFTSVREAVKRVIARRIC